MVMHTCTLHANFLSVSSVLANKLNFTFVVMCSIQDYCITLTTGNSTQINTSRQCMLKSIHITTD